MVTINQIQAGFARFVDVHIAGAYSGIEKAIVLGGSTLFAASIPNVVKAYSEKPIVSALGVCNPTTGYVDIDALYNAFVPHMGSDKIPITLPKLGSINLGTIKLGREEVDALVRYIKEA